MENYELCKRGYGILAGYKCMTNGKTVAIYFGHPKLHQLTSARCKNLPTFGSHLLLARLREILFRL